MTKSKEKNNKMEQELKDVVRKTGTSIIGIVCKDGIVMAADRQVSAGQSLVVGKKEQKVIQINDYAVASWCGTASDAQFLKKIVQAELRLKHLHSGERPTIKQVANLFATMSYRNIRQFSMIPSIVGTLIGGYNEDGIMELYSIEPAGSVIKVDEYDANFGSGMPYMLGVLEANYKKDMDLKQGIDLATQCLKASTQRDTASGYGIDIFTITKEGINHEVKQEITSEFKDEKK
jgi:proteasome beta subunit